jgi:predicted DNA-binding transcriptional regulator YafY
LKTSSPVPSPTYDLIEQAMTSRKQVLCTYDGYPRELCPVILGHTNGEEVVLAYQFAGQSNSGLPPEGQWKCLRLSKVSNVQLRDGPWHAGFSHIRRQPCVQVVDLDVNPASPYSPKRRL